MSKKITLLGSTGSIGTQSLDVIRAQGYEVFGLSAHSHVDKILQQIEEFHPKYVCMTDPDAAAKLDAALSGRAGAPKLLTGPEGLLCFTEMFTSEKSPVSRQRTWMRCLQDQMLRIIQHGFFHLRRTSP